MANRGNPKDAHIVLTEFDGTTNRFLLRPKSRIQRGPTTGQGQVTTIGESERRGDTRTPQIIWSDQAGGMGEFAYQEINGNTSFTDSDLDTRYPGQLVLPPLATQLGGTLPSLQTYPLVEYLGQTNARIIVWTHNSAANAACYYDPVGLAWVAVAALTRLSGFCRFNAKYVFARITNTATNGIYHSTDGVTWTAVAGRTKACRGLCVHDDKMYTFNATDNRLEWTTDPTVADASYAASAVLPLDPSEVIIQVFEWQRGGRAAVFLLTNFRLLWYDEDADHFATFDDSWRGLTDATYMLPRAAASPSSGNLYLTLFNRAEASLGDLVLEYTGTRNLMGPNRRGGMPSASQVSLRAPLPAYNWMFFVGVGRIGTTNVGRMLALNDQGGWHTLLTGTSSSAVVAGGGYAIGKLWTVLSDSTVWEQAVPDATDLPLYATGRTYKTSTTLYHEYAFTDLGSENLPLTALWVEVACRDMTTTYKGAGMFAGGTGVVQYLRDTDTAWTTLGTFSSADSYPVRFPFRTGYGLMANEIKIRVGILSNNSAKSPVVVSVALAALREEAVRDAYACVVDLSRDSHVLYGGKSRAQLLTVLERIRQPGVLVKLQFAGGDDTVVPSTGRTITNCKVEWSGEEDAEEGPGMYSLRLTDDTVPSFTSQIAAQPAS